MPEDTVYWRRVWESKAGESDFAATGRSSADPHQIFILLADAAAALQLTGQDSLLDVGCGVGLLGRHLAPFVSALVGVDFAVPLLARARGQSSSARFAAGNILALPFREGSFSRVLVSGVLAYLRDDDAVGRALAEVRRVTAPAGRAFCSANPDQHHKEEYIAGIDRLDLPEDRKTVIRERNQNAYWMSPESLVQWAEDTGWRAEVRPISASVWQSFYMFDVLLTAK